MNKKFFDMYRERYGKLSQKQVDGLNLIGDNLLKDDELTLAQKAYILATVKHETANTYQPIREYGRGRGRRYGKPDRETGKTYYGRGYVQLTWKSNYSKVGSLLDVDLVHNPHLALEPDVAYKILVIGMKKGLFTGKKLSDYINDKETNFYRARKIVNGLDKANLIAKYAKVFKKILRKSGE